MNGKRYHGNLQDGDITNEKDFRDFFVSKHPELFVEYYDYVIERMQAYRDYLFDVKQRIDRLKKRVKEA